VCTDLVTRPRLIVLPRPPRSTAFPYTTLFRSWRNRHRHQQIRQRRGKESGLAVPGVGHVSANPVHDFEIRAGRFDADPFLRICRSEEHTSELQSRENLVCRLLLEKKKSQKLQL